MATKDKQICERWRRSGELHVSRKKGKISFFSTFWEYQRCILALKGQYRHNTQGMESLCLF